MRPIDLEIKKWQELYLRLKRMVIIRITDVKNSKEERERWQLKSDNLDDNWKALVKIIEKLHEV